MKKTLLRFFWLTFVMLGMASCKNDDSNDDNSTSADQVIAIATEGNWNITYFFDSDTDKTASFTDFDFTFNSSGTVDAANDIAAVSGTWSVIDGSANSSDDDGNSTDDDDFNLAFPDGSIGDFEELTDDWDIVSVTDTKIELTDVSGGSGSANFLTFEKN